MSNHAHFASSELLLPTWCAKARVEVRGKAWDQGPYQLELLLSQESPRWPGQGPKLGCLLKMRAHFLPYREVTHILHHFQITMVLPLPLTGKMRPTAYLASLASPSLSSVLCLGWGGQTSTPSPLMAGSCFLCGQQCWLTLHLPGGVSGGN